jgi:hypothetical protein
MLLLLNRSNRIKYVKTVARSGGQFMPYNKLPSQEIIKKTIASINSRGIAAEYAASKGEALERIKSLILERESPALQRKLILIIVNEILGF